MDENHCSNFMGIFGGEMSIPRALKTSNSDEWPTPQWLFDLLDLEFGFTLDPCCTEESAKCSKFYTVTENGLLKNWAEETVFMNPPYSHVSDWMQKAYGSAQDGATVVCLVPSRTDTKWWHKYAMKGEIRFIRGRLKFGNATENAPFPSCVIVFRPKAFNLVSMVVK